MTHIKVKPDLQDNIYSSEYYNMYNARDFYKGTAFRMNEWTENTHYFHDVHIIDFVSFEGCLLYCLQSHLSTEYNKPVVITENNVIVGIEPSIYWHFIMGSNGKGEKGEKGDSGSAGTISIGKVTTGDAGSNVIIENVGTAENAILNFTIPKGDPGEKGIQGEPGKTPILSATIDNVTSTEVAAASVQLENDTFKFTFDLPKGEPGQDGQDGQQGPPGKDGQDGETGPQGPSGQDGLSVKVLYTKTDSVDDIPVVVKDNANPGSIWGSGIPIHTTNDAIWSIWAYFRGTDLVGEWTDPILISGIKGETGTVPNYKVYIYKNNSSKPDKPTTDQLLPEGWLEYPTGDGTWWQCIGIVNGSTNLVTSWSEVIPLNGKDGIAQDGKYTEFRFAVNNSYITPPSLDNSQRSPEGWTVIPPKKDPEEYMWMITATIAPGDILYTNWTTPVVISGGIGDWTSYIFKQSNEKPETPTGTNPIPDGWLDAPSGSGIWWMSKAIINGVSGLAGEWSDPIRVTGEEGAPGKDGSWIDFKYAKNNSSITAPEIDKDNVSPPGWTDNPPELETGERLWMSKSKKDANGNFWQNSPDSYWSDPVRISGEDGNDGATGPAGNQGPAGKDGVDGIPGVTIEVRYSKGNESTYTGSSDLGNKRNPDKWELSIPETDEEYPYIWFIQARIVYSNNEDMTGSVYGNWSTPHILSGINGLDGVNGDKGDKGQIIYPEGIYNVDTIYSCTKDKAPYVYDSGDGNFYVLNALGTWQGTLHSNESPSTDTSGSWVKLEAFEALYTKIGIIANGLIGSAVFNNEYMFSQQGINSEGNPSSSYELFDPENPYEGEFIPNILFNFETGNGHLGAGKIKFEDGKVTTENITIGSSSNFEYEYAKPTGESAFTTTTLHSVISHADTSITYIDFDPKKGNWKVNGIYEGIVLNITNKIANVTIGNPDGSDPVNIRGYIAGSPVYDNNDYGKPYWIGNVKLAPGAALKYLFIVDKVGTSHVEGSLYITNASEFTILEGIKLSGPSGENKRYTIQSKGIHDSVPIGIRDIVKVKMVLGKIVSLTSMADQFTFDLKTVEVIGNTKTKGQIFKLSKRERFEQDVRLQVLPIQYKTGDVNLQLIFSVNNPTFQDIEIFVDGIKAANPDSANSTMQMVSMETVDSYEFDFIVYSICGTFKNQLI